MPRHPLILGPLILGPLILGVAAAMLVSAHSAAAPAPAVHIVPSISAPDGRWDFASWDAAHQRVLVAHGIDVLVIDPAPGAANGAVRAIGKLAGAHGVLAIPGTDTLLVSSGHDDSVRILDETSGAEVARIPVVADPDAMILSVDGRTAYVMGADSGAISILDLATKAETGRIALKPGLEVPVLVSPTLLAVNNEKVSEIELADLASGTMAGVIALPGCTGPTGLALDPETGVALSSCANGVAALVDISARRLLALVPIGQGPDTAIWQKARHHFLVPCGRSGTLSIVALDGRKAHALPPVTTEVSARTAALDPASGALYLPAARLLPAVAGARPAPAPGSFHLLVLAPR